MNLARIADIVDLSRELGRASLGETFQDEANAASILLKIIAKAIQAYEEHTGQPLDPSLIKVEAPQL